MSPPDETSPVADRVLDQYRTFAVVGASPDPARPSHGVMAALERYGYEVIPVNPKTNEIRGRTCHPNVASIPEPIEVVDIFRRSEVAGTHVDEAIRVGAKAVWLQLGVIDEAAAQRARDAGLEVVMDHCPAIELDRRHNEQESDAL